jgi:ABC-type multidrug transport system fused ATPase/permease subunit
VPEKAAKSPSALDGAATAGNNAVLQVLGAIATGIGVIGFVAVVGGMIIYTRADAAGLPADQALAVVPRTSLVAAGAVTLVPALALAFLFALVLFAFGRALERLESHAIDVRYAPALRLEEQAAYEEQAARDARVIQRQANTQADATERTLAALAGGPAPDEALLAQLRSQLAAERAASSTAGANAARATANAEQLTEAAAEMREKQAEASWKVRWTRFGAAAVLLLLFAMAALAVGAGGIGVDQWLVLIVLAAGTAFVSVSIYANKGRRFLFIVSSFVAIGLFVGLVSYFKTHNTPKLEPAAALRADGTIVFGYFVAESDNDLYIARRASTGVPARILQLPRSELTDVSVGKLTALSSHPLLHARGIARRLCAEGARGATAVTTDTKANTVAKPPAPPVAPVLDATELRCMTPAAAPAKPKKKFTRSKPGKKKRNK